MKDREKRGLIFEILFVQLILNGIHGVYSGAARCVRQPCVCVSICAYVRARDRKRDEISGVLLDGLTHIQAHLHAVPGVVRQRLRQTRHTVVTIAQDLDSHALVFLKEDEVQRGNGEKGALIINIQNVHSY